VTAANGGQKLTPNGDVYAPAGFGGSKWGAYGGGITPIAQPKSPLVNMSRAGRDATAVIDSKNNLTLKTGLSNAAISGRTADLVYADDSTTQVWTADQQSPDVADSQL
jgi:hypothetical protein